MNLLVVILAWALGAGLLLVGASAALRYSGDPAVRRRAPWALGAGVVLVAAALAGGLLRRTLDRPASTETFTARGVRFVGPERMDVQARHLLETWRSFGVAPVAADFYRPVDGCQQWPERPLFCVNPSLPRAYEGALRASAAELGLGEPRRGCPSAEYHALILSDRLDDLVDLDVPLGEEHALSADVHTLPVRLWIERGADGKDVLVVAGDTSALVPLDAPSAGPARIKLSNSVVSFRVSATAAAAGDPTHRRVSLYGLRAGCA